MFRKLFAVAVIATAAVGCTETSLNGPNAPEAAQNGQGAGI